MADNDVMLGETSCALNDNDDDVLLMIDTGGLNVAVVELVLLTLTVPLVDGDVVCCGPSEVATVLADESVELAALVSEEAAAALLLSVSSAPLLLLVV